MLLPKIYKYIHTCTHTHTHIHTEKKEDQIEWRRS